MLIHDVSLQKLHAVFCIDRAGIVGSDGETHHGIFDVAYLTSVPNMSIYCPASFRELEDMLQKALYETDGPVAVRYPRGGEGEYKGSCTDEECIIKKGTDVTIVTYGTMINEAVTAAELLEEKGVSAEVIKIGRLRPNSFELTLASLKKTGRLVAAEEVCEVGCAGRIILAAAASRGVAPRTALLNLGEGIVAQGGRAALMRDMGIDAAAIMSAAEKIIRREHEEAKA